MTPALHVLFGSGGVGKTTLAAGYALALADADRRVGLLGIDPARRLQDALGVALSDTDVPVAGADNLSAALVEPHRALTRWFRDSCSDAQAGARLDHNPFFRALTDRLATATDVLAAVRIAEWAERDPGLTDLVVDTAPGMAALDFIRAPTQLHALVSGRMVRWLRAAAGAGSGLTRLAHRVLTGLAEVVGTTMVADLADFFALVQQPLEVMVDRLAMARRWLHSRDAHLLLVTSSHDTGAAGAIQLARALGEADLRPRAVIVNRTWPASLAAELAAAGDVSGARPLVDYIGAHLAGQQDVLDAVAALAPRVVTLPARDDLDRGGRDALFDLGADLHRQLTEE